MQQKIEDDSRVFSILKKDGFSNLEKILPILQKELKELFNEYFDIDKTVKIRFKQTENGLAFYVEFFANKVKTMFVL